MAQPGFLTRLFDRKPRLDHPIVERRLEALSNLRTTQQEEFVRVAQTDESSEVRLAALQRIDSPDQLAQFLEAEDLAEIAVARICESINLEHDLMQHERIRPVMLSRVEDGTALARFALSLKTNQEIAEAIFNGATTAIRQEAVGQVKSNEVLHLCEHLSRNDKGLNRFIRDRIKERKNLETKQNTLLKRADALIDSANKNDSTQPNYLSIRESQESNWEGFLNMIRRLNDDLREAGIQELDIDMLQARFPARGTIREENPYGAIQFVEILSKLRDLKNDPTTELVDQAEGEWLEALKTEAAPIELSNEFHELTGQIRKDIKRQLRIDDLEPKYRALAAKMNPSLPDLTVKGNWHKVWQIRKDTKNLHRDCERFLKLSELDLLDASTKGEWTHNIETLIQQCEALQEQTDELFESTNKDIEEKVEDLQTKVAAGRTKEATHIERAIRNLINRLPEPARRKPSDLLAPASIQLHDLLNWKKFATVPKREELLGQIQKLCDEPLEPLQQQAQIQSLRLAWNSLGPPVSGDEMTLQKQYDEAANGAWQTCKVYFDAQNEIRTRNTDLKESIAKELERIAETTDWDNADWAAINKELQSRRNQYDEIRNIQRSRIRKVNKRFYKSFDYIRGKINEQREHVDKLKQELIAQVREVAANESLEEQQQVTQVKAIQTKWREVGVTFYKREEQLWEEFRDVCNGIFESRRLAYEERKKGIDTNIAGANRIVDSLLDEAKKGPQNLNQGSIDDTIKRLDELHLPKRVRDALAKKLDRVDDLIAGKKEAIRQLATRERLDLLLKCDAELAGYETSNTAIPEEWFDTVQTDSVLYETRVPIEDDSQRQDIVDIMLRAEIRADIEPLDEAEEERRLKLKVEDLSETMGRSEASPAEIAEKLINQWIAVAHGETDVRERFNKAMVVLLDRISD